MFKTIRYIKALIKVLFYGFIIVYMCFNVQGFFITIITPVIKLLSILFKSLVYLVQFLISNPISMLLDIIISIVSIPLDIIGFILSIPFKIIQFIF